MKMNRRQFLKASAVTAGAMLAPALAAANIKQVDIDEIQREAMDEGGLAYIVFDKVTLDRYGYHATVKHQPFGTPFGRAITVELNGKPIGGITCRQKSRSRS